MALLSDIEFNVSIATLLNGNEICDLVAVLLSDIGFIDSVSALLICNRLRDNVAGWFGFVIMD